MPHSGTASTSSDELPLPFERASLELAYGQMLRRRGHRRAASVQLESARERFAALGARPFVERCVRELESSGLDADQENRCRS